MGRDRRSDGNGERQVVGRSGRGVSRRAHRLLARNGGDPFLAWPRSSLLLEGAYSHHPSFLTISITHHTQLAEPHPPHESLIFELLHRMDGSTAPRNSSGGFIIVFSVIRLPMQVHLLLDQYDHCPPLPFVAELQSTSERLEQSLQHLHSSILPQSESRRLRRRQDRTT